MRSRTIVLICLAAGLVLLPFMAYISLMTFAIVTRPDLAAAVEGCPSHALPAFPGSRLFDSSEITVGSDQGPTTGCWATYDEPGPATGPDILSYYTDPRNTSGWRLDEAYANTGYAAFSSTTVPRLRADISVATPKQFLVTGPSMLRLDISVCMCDPGEMAQ